MEEVVTFRKMRRFGQQLEDKDTRALLKTLKRGTLAVDGLNGYPYCFTIDFLYIEEENAIYFHGAKAGYKVECLEKDAKVCFTAIDKGQKSPRNWGLDFNSVIVFGKATLLKEEEKIKDVCRTFFLKYYNNEEECQKELDRALPRVAVYKIEIEHMTGKRVNES